MPAKAQAMFKGMAQIFTVEGSSASVICRRPRFEACAGRGCECPPFDRKSETAPDPLRAFGGPAYG